MLSWLNTYSVPLHAELQRDTTTIMDFDGYEELLWIGSENGRVLSYLASPDSFQPYTRFQASPTRVTGLLFDSQSVLVLGANSLSAFTRGGCPIASNVLSQSSVDRMTLGGAMDLHAFEFYSGGLAIGGMQRQLYLADLRTGQLSGVIDLGHDVGKIIKLPNNSLIIGGASTGEVTLIDGRTPKPIATALAHPRGVTSLATDSASLVISTGLRDGVNPFGTSTLVPDVFCKCFDVRTLKSVAPVSVSSGANAVLVNRSKLGVSPTVTVLSNFGMWQEGELCNDGHMKQPEFYRTDCYPSESGVLTVNSWTLSSTCALLAQVDAADFIHMWHQVRVGGAINPYSQATMLPSRRLPTGARAPDPDNVAGSVAQVMTCVHASYTDAVRSSGYQNMSSTLGLSGIFTTDTPVRPPLPLVPEVKMNLRQGNEWTYAVNPLQGKLPYNSLVSRARAISARQAKRLAQQLGQLPKTSTHSTSKTGARGRIRAESAISDIMSPRGFNSEDEGEAGLPGNPGVLPRKRFRFRAVDHSMNHSLFPFSSFNRTRFTGLENSGTSWDLFINALVQVAFYLQPLRDTCSEHVCSEEACIVCELGFLFHSMQRGVAVCQATRLVRCLKRDPHFTSIVEEHRNHPAAIAGPFLRKLFEEVQQQMRSNPTLISEAGRTVLDRLLCHDDNLLVHVKTNESVSFTHAVFDGLRVSRGRIPPVLVVVPSSQSAVCWRQAGYLAPTLYVEHERGPSGRVIRVTSALPPSGQASACSTTRFDLVAVTLHIADVETKQAPQGHLVTMVEAGAHGISHTEVSGSESDNELGSPEESNEHRRWLIFNDFVLSQSNLAEALDLSQVWKKPVVLMYVNRDGFKSVRPILPYSQVSSRERSSLSSASSPVSVPRGPAAPAVVSGRNESGGRSHIPLSLFLEERSVNTPEIVDFKSLSEPELQQVLNGGMTFALDAEFIATGLGAVEIREDGSKETSRPQEMSLGRVTVLRENGEAIIDHYIETDERGIKDWVTRFSGLKKGDLNKETSKYYLSTSKQVYLKLRFLVDHGCRFIGHGLATDFRIIGLVVPKANLIDTVELFHLPQQRLLSLKFLAAKLLDREIQGDVHCSSEDALAALDLWRLHKKLKEEGRIDVVLQRLYDTGRMQGWK